MNCIYVKNEETKRVVILTSHTSREKIDYSHVTFTISKIFNTIISKIIVKLFIK